MPTRGFTLGDHTFLHPSQPGPMSRLSAKKRQILGAPPPTILDGIAREATAKSPAAKALFKGEFCGHGEPTMTIFDIVIDGVSELEISGVMDEDDPDNEQNLPLVVVRKPGDKKWTVLFRREWEERGAGLEGVKRTPLSPSDASDVNEEIGLGQVSVGFEYPCDAESKDGVSWMTVDVLFKGEKSPTCIVNAELA
jgi:hypothetical protein